MQFISCKDCKETYLINKDVKTNMLILKPAIGETFVSMQDLVDHSTAPVEISDFECNNCSASMTESYEVLTTPDYLFTVISR